MDQPAASTGKVRTRLNVLFAAAAPRAVILRRGPRTHWRLITWDLRKDIFTPGQWMVGLVRLCDLSPFGDKIIYWAAQHRRRELWVGYSTVEAILGNKLAPGLADRYLARTAISGPI